MKKLFVLWIALAVTIIANAQSHSDSIKDAYSKIQLLESRWLLQDARIAQLSEKVDEVVSQNLALKKNLNLSPTIATDNVGGCDYKILKVEGDTATNVVHILMVVENISDADRRMLYNGFEIIDELGNSYPNSVLEEKVKMFIGGGKENLIKHMYIHRLEVPLKIDVYIKTDGTDMQYVKYFQLSMFEPDDKTHISVVFKNLPIKWK